MTRVRDVFEPIKNNVEIYRRAVREGLPEDVQEAPAPVQGDPEDHRLPGITGSCQDRRAVECPVLRRQLGVLRMGERIRRE